MRYYCPQVCNSMRGWQDLPDLARASKKEADDLAEAFAHESMQPTRVIRKPKGWTPEGKPMPKKEFSHEFSLGEQARESRRMKR